MKIKASPSMKDIRNVKLNPLVSETKENNLKEKPKSLHIISIKNKGKTNRKSIDAGKIKAKTKDIKNSQDSKKSILDEDAKIESASSKSDKVSSDFIERFYSLALKIKARTPSILRNIHWYKYKSWRSVLKRGINLISRNWKNKKALEILIINWLKNRIKIRSFYEKVKSSNIIGYYWKNVYKSKKIFKAAKLISLLLNPIAKRIYLKKSRCSIIIQKHIRRYLTYSKYKQILSEKASLRKHKEMLQRQSLLVKSRNTRKNAVKKIENMWINYKRKQKIRETVKYLSTLPYECRLLYIKFKQVKQDADNLKNDVDALILKKKEPGSFNDYF